MSLERGKISNLQLAFIITGFMLGTYPLASISIKMAKQDAWLTLFPALATSIILIFVFTTLARRFPGKTLIDINNLTFGNPIGQIASLLYLSFFFHMAGANLRYVGDYVSIILPETPQIVFTVLFIMICGSAVRSGIEVITRCSQILVPIAIFIIIINFFLLTNKMELNNLLPVMEIPWINFFKTQHLITVFSTGPLVVFLMVIASTNQDRATTRSAILATLVSSLAFLFIIIRNILVLGSTNTIFTLTSFEAVRLIDIADVFTRLDILVVLTELTMSYLRIAVFYYAIVLGVAQILGLKSYLPLVPPIGAFIIINSIIIYDFPLDYFSFIIKVFPYYSLPVVVILPLLTLAMAVLRKRSA